jgi:DNA-binding SARP family transcriptional activator
MSDSELRSEAPVRRLELRVLGTSEPQISIASAPGTAPPTGADERRPVSPFGVDERRLLALLAVSPSGRPAEELARLLWPERSIDAALGTLQAVCDALGQAVVAADGMLRLGADVDVDLHRALDRLRAWRRDPYQVEALAPDELVDLLSQDLLPGRREPWAEQEREGFRRVRLHALESLCQRLTVLGRFEPAIRAGLLVVEAEPMRESAHRALIEAHLAAGNVSEAVNQYEAFIECCVRLGLAPGAELSEFFPPSPAWPVLHVRRPIAFGSSIGRGLRLDQPTRHAQVGVGPAARG